MLSGDDIPPQRTLAELKAECLLRAERNAYPLIGLGVEVVAAALDRIRTLGPDEWGEAWMAFGDPIVREAESLVEIDQVAADQLYLKAWRIYSFGRWPVPSSPSKQRAYAKALSAFRQHARLMDPPLKVVRLPFEHSEITGYMQLPAAHEPVPIVIAISGLDSRKEDVAERFGWLVPNGIGYFAVDGPGTGEAPVKVGETAERMYQRILDELLKYFEIDPKRIAVFGGSFGGHWALKLAARERERLAAVIVQSPPVHAAFEPFSVTRALQNREYLFDYVPAQMAAFGGGLTLASYTKLRERQSLVTQDLLNRPMPPMLVIAGARDTQVPFSDINLLLASGSNPKDAWINPQGGHMGRDAIAWNDVRIFREIVMPWLLKRLRDDRCRESSILL